MKMLNLKIHETKHPGNLGHHEKTKPKNDRNIEKREGEVVVVVEVGESQRTGKHFQQNYTRKTS